MEVEHEDFDAISDAMMAHNSAVPWVDIFACTNSDGCERGAGCWKCLLHSFLNAFK